MNVTPATSRSIDTARHLPLETDPADATSPPGTAPHAPLDASGEKTSDALAELDAEARRRWESPDTGPRRDGPSGPGGPGSAPAVTPAPPAGLSPLDEANAVLDGFDVDAPALDASGFRVSERSYPSGSALATSVTGALGSIGGHTPESSGSSGSTSPGSTVADVDRTRVTDAAHVDLGGERQLLYVNRSDGSRDVFVVEDGVATARLEAGESVDLGQLRSARMSADGERVEMSAFAGTRATLSDDLGQLEIRQRQLVGFWPGVRVGRTEVHSVETGNLIVLNGRALPDAMTDAERFAFYSDTTEGEALLQLEGDIYTSDAHRDLFVARVRYARGEGGPELFDAFTPRRASLSGEALARHDAEITRVMDHLREIGQYTREGERVAALDESMLYILASAAVEGYGDSPERLDHFIADVDGRFIISIDNAESVETATGNASAGWYGASSGTIQANLPSMLRSYLDPDDGFDIVVHEIAHSLDYSPRDGFDGVPAGMSLADATVLRTERARLFALAYPGMDLSDLSSFQRDGETIVDNSGLGDYAFTNEVEFFAELTARFLVTDGSAAEIARISPELHRVLRDHYGRTGLSSAETPYVSRTDASPPTAESGRSGAIDGTVWPPI